MAYNKDLYLYITAVNRTAKVRFYGLIEEFFQSYDNINRMTFFTKERPKKSDSGNFYSKRVISLVVDREDDNIKLFACPISVWNQIDKPNIDYIKYDYEIKRVGNGLTTRYDVFRSEEETTISEEQEKSIDATLKHFSFESILIQRKNWEIISEIPQRVKSRFELLDL